MTIAEKLQEKIKKIEAENKKLKAENTELKAEIEQLKKFIKGENWNEPNATQSANFTEYKTSQKHDENDEWKPDDNSTTEPYV